MTSSGGSRFGASVTCRGKDYDMRLARYSLLAALAITSLSGCTAWRDRFQARTAPPVRQHVPPLPREYNDRAYDVNPGYADPTLSSPPTVPVEPPPVPPAVGVSRVKSVGLLRDLGDKLTSPFRHSTRTQSAELPCSETACADQTTTDRCGTDAGCTAGCGTSPRSLLGQLIRRHHCGESYCGESSAGCGHSCDTAGCATAPAHGRQSCGDEGCGLIRPGTCGECGETWRDRTSAFGQKRPCLAEPLISDECRCRPQAFQAPNPQYTAPTPAVQPAPQVPWQQNPVPTVPIFQGTGSQNIEPPAWPGRRQGQTTSVHQTIARPARGVTVPPPRPVSGAARGGVPIIIPRNTET